MDSFFSLAQAGSGKMEGSGAHAASGLTRRGSIGGGGEGGLRAKSDAKGQEVTSPGRTRLPGGPHPAQSAPAAASQAVALGHPPVYLSGKGGSRERLAVRADGARGIWTNDKLPGRPEHSGHPLTLAVPSQEPRLSG